MSSFTCAQLDVEITDATRQGRGLVRLTAPFGFDYHVGHEGSDDIVTVPTGYVSDLLSVPRWARGLIAPLSPGAKAAVIHDFLYDQPRPRSRTRARIDAIFREACRVEGVGLIERWALWAAVRMQALLRRDVP